MTRFTFATRAQRVFDLSESSVSLWEEPGEDLAEYKYHFFFSVSR